MGDRQFGNSSKRKTHSRQIIIKKVASLPKNKKTEVDSPFYKPYSSPPTYDRERRIYDPFEPTLSDEEFDLTVKTTEDDLRCPEKISPNDTKMNSQGNVKNPTQIKSTDIEMKIGLPDNEQLCMLEDAVRLSALSTKSPDIIKDSDGFKDELHRLKNRNDKSSEHCSSRRARKSASEGIEVGKEKKRKKVSSEERKPDSQNQKNQGKLRKSLSCDSIKGDSKDRSHKEQKEHKRHRSSVYKKNELEFSMGESKLTDKSVKRKHKSKDRNDDKYQEKDDSDWERRQSEDIELKGVRSKYDNRHSSKTKDWKRPRIAEDKMPSRKDSSRHFSKNSSHLKKSKRKHKNKRKHSNSSSPDREYGKSSVKEFKSSQKKKKKKKYSSESFETCVETAHGNIRYKLGRTDHRSERHTSAKDGSYSNSKKKASDIKRHTKHKNSDSSCQIGNSRSKTKYKSSSHKTLDKTAAKDIGDNVDSLLDSPNNSPGMLLDCHIVEGLEISDHHQQSCSESDQIGASSPFSVYSTSEIYQADVRHAGSPIFEKSGDEKEPPVQSPPISNNGDSFHQNIKECFSLAEEFVEQSRKRWQGKQKPIREAQQLDEVHDQELRVKNEEYTSSERSTSSDKTENTSIKNPISHLLRNKKSCSEDGGNSPDVKSPITARESPKDINGHEIRNNCSKQNFVEMQLQTSDDAKDEDTVERPVEIEIDCTTRKDDRANGVNLTSEEFMKSQTKQCASLQDAVPSSQSMETTKDSDFKVLVHKMQEDLLTVTTTSGTDDKPTCKNEKDMPAGEKEGGILNPTQILHRIGLNPQQQSEAQNAILSIAELSKHLHLDKLVSGHRSKDTEQENSTTNIDSVESSAVEMYNEDKKRGHLKKIKFQEQVIEQAKQAIKPYYERRQISKDEYKDILKKAVNKICSSELSREVNIVKIRRLIRRYIEKYQQRKLTRKEKIGTRNNVEPMTRRSPTAPKYQPLSSRTVDSLTAASVSNCPLPFSKREAKKAFSLPELQLPPPPPPPKPHI